MPSWLSSILSIISNALGLVKQRDSEVNSAAMQSAKESQIQQDGIDKGREVINKAAETGDLDELRKGTQS